ncbi:helix-turn-helix transcriptional regulator [Eggerthellaceae bacterium 3-80]
MTHFVHYTYAMGKIFTKLNTTAELRRDHLSGILPFLCGMGCIRAWITLVIAAPTIMPFAGFDHHNLFDYTIAIVSLSSLIFIKRILPLNNHPNLRVIACICMTAASFLFSLSYIIPGPTYIFSLACPILGGIGFVIFSLLWSETISALPLLRIFLYTTACNIFAVVVVFFCAGLDTSRMLLIVLLLPSIALLGLKVGYTNLPADGQPFSAAPRTSYPWKLFLLLGLYSFAYGLRQSELAAGAGMHSSASTLIINVVLFLSVYFFWNRFNVGTLYRSPFVLIICGFLLVPVENFFGVNLSSYLISMSYSLVSIVIALLMYDFSKRLGITIVIFSAIRASEQIFVVWGKDAAALLNGLPLAEDTVDILITVLIVGIIAVSALILLSERELASKWGVRILEPGGLVEKTPEEEQLSIRCNELAQRCHLTPREAEIMHLIAQGKTNAAIASELFIAEGTLKAHTSHIYEKTGLTNRKELKEQLGVADKK